MKTEEVKEILDLLQGVVEFVPAVKLGIQSLSGPMREIGRELLPLMEDLNTVSIDAKIRNYKRMVDAGIPGEHAAIMLRPVASQISLPSFPRK